MSELIRDAAQADSDALLNLRDALLRCQSGARRLRLGGKHERATRFAAEVEELTTDLLERCEVINEAVWDDDMTAQDTERAEAALRASQRRLPLDARRAA